MKRPKVLSIAGFDPSAGAGILADIKTFEQHKVSGFGINTANTVQNEHEFFSVEWVDSNLIFQQLEMLFKTHQFRYTKIGLIPNLKFLETLISHFKPHLANIIWDPILSASSGFSFNHDLESLHHILKQVYLITPNWEEMKKLSGHNNSLEGAKQLSAYAKVYLKGGHNEQELGKDHLFANDKYFAFRPKTKKAFPKHGSGCVFSSSLAANLAKGYPLKKGCLKAKGYTAKFLESNPTLLGYHK